MPEAPPYFYIDRYIMRAALRQQLSVSAGTIYFC